MTRHTRPSLPGGHAIPLNGRQTRPHRCSDLHPAASAARQRSAARKQQRAQALVADVIDHSLGDQELLQLGQAPRENGRSWSTGWALAIFLISRRWPRVNFGARPVPGVERTETIGVEVVDHVTDPVLAGERHLRDPGHVHARADSSTICARRQVTTDPLPRRTISTSRRPSSSSISRTRTRSATGSVWTISCPVPGDPRCGLPCGLLCLDSDGRAGHPGQPADLRQPRRAGGRW
jgi:hypothetical protein